MLQALQPQRSDSNDQQQQQSVIINDKDMQPQPLIVVSWIFFFIAPSSGVIVPLFSAKSCNGLAI